MKMKSIYPGEATLKYMHQSLLCAIGPRPICFASTVDSNGVRNLSPFSFFNVFSGKPPILVFSPARSGRTGETKNTLDNVLEVPEVVINIVTYRMAYQMNLASSPYEKEVDEFVKSGFTPLASELVKPARVAESPAQLECKVTEVKSLGNNPGAGNLVICEVLAMHVDESALNENGLIDQTTIDLIGRMGGNYYVRAHGSALFEIDKQVHIKGIGVDALPHHIRNSEELTGNELGMLGSLETLPAEEEIIAYRRAAKEELSLQMARELLKQHRTAEALMVLLGMNKDSKK